MQTHCQKSVDGLRIALICAAIALCVRHPSAQAGNVEVHEGAFQKVETEDDKKVNAAYKAKDFALLEKICTEILKKEPKNSERQYDLACAQSRLDKKDDAFASLFKCRDAEYFNMRYYFNHLCEDTDLVSLHADKRWTEMTEKLKPVVERNEKIRAINGSLMSSFYGQKYKDVIEQTDQLMKFATDPKEIYGALLFRAQSLAMLGQKTEALDTLEKYIPATQYFIDDLENDKYLFSLKKEPRFKALAEKAKQKSAELVAARSK